MFDATVRRNLFTMLRFYIKGFIDIDSIKRNALTRVDVSINGHITPIATKNKIKYHLLQRNPRAYLAVGSAHFDHTPLG
jgi:hypothetical protein